MEQLQEIIIASALSILLVLIKMAVYSVKDYLATKGGLQAVRIAEIVASNVVRAVEQMTVDKEIHGLDKFLLAKQKAKAELAKYNINLSDSQINTFIEAAVKAMNDGWKGVE